MTVNFILLLIFTLINLILAIFIYFKNPKDKINVWFSLITLSVALWAFTNAVCLRVETLKGAILWSQISYISAILIAGSFLYFSLIFPTSISALNEYQPKKYHKIYLALAVPLISIITLIPGFTIKNIILHPWKIITGPGLYIFAIYFFGTMGWAFYNLIKKYFISQGIERMQMKYLFLGATLSSLFGSFCNLILPLQGDYRFVWLGPVFTIFLIGFTALAILKYHLFEIRVILTELLVGVMGIILLVLPFLMPSLTLKALTIAIFLLFCIFGYYLIRATHEESKRREEAEVLAARERILKEEAERLAKERGKLAEQ